MSSPFRAARGSDRFPGFDVLAFRDYWDPVTAGVVLERLSPQTMVAFFTDDEVSVARPLLDLLVGQEADDDPRVDVLDLVDTRLARGETDGWRYDDLPEDGEAWRRTLAWLDDDAQATFKRSFAHCVTSEQKQLIQAVQDLSTDSKKWHDYEASRVWSLWTRYACAAFYSHPYAWNEMGFDGPAYPRGYLALGVNKREKWEVRDHGEAEGSDFGDAP
jgi:hypothetical protein